MTTTFFCLSDHYHARRNTPAIRFVLITATIGWMTYRKVSADLAAGGLGTAREEVFFAGKGLSWVVVAGSSR